jgi:hypothetical protein
MPYHLQEMSYHLHHVQDVTKSALKYIGGWFCPSIQISPSMIIISSENNVLPLECT